MSIALELWRVVEGWDPKAKRWRIDKGLPGAGRFMPSPDGLPSLADVVRGTAAGGPKRLRGEHGSVADAVRAAARLSDTTGRPTQRPVAEHRAHGAHDVADEVERALDEVPVTGDVRRAVAGRARAAADSHGARPDSLPEPPKAREPGRTGSHLPGPSPEPVAAPTPATKALTSGQRVAAAEAGVRTAHAELARMPGDWVPLAEIRDRLSGHDRADVDAALERLAMQPGVQLIPWDNRKALTARDHEAALHFGGEANNNLRIESGPLSIEPVQVKPGGGSRGRVDRMSDADLERGLQMHGNQSAQGRRVQAEVTRRAASKPRAAKAAPPKAAPKAADRSQAARGRDALAAAPIRDFRSLDAATTYRKDLGAVTIDEDIADIGGGIRGDHARDALVDYSDQGYQYINDALRKAGGDLDRLPDRVDVGIPGHYSRSRAEAGVRGIDALMQRSPLQRDVVVHRGINDPRKTFPGWREGGDNAGLQFVDHSYVSTSTAETAARKFAGNGAGVKLNILAPAGTHAMGVESTQPGLRSERELLLDRGLTYRIVADRKVDGVRTVDVEVVPAGASPAKAAAAAAAHPHDDAVRAAYQRLAAQEGDWVGMADLREQLGGMSRPDQDAALRRLVHHPDVQIEEETNQKTLKIRDRDAAINIGDRDQHVIAIAPPVQRAPRARKAATFGPSDAAAVAAHLETAGSLADAKERLGRLTAPQLRQVAGLLGATVGAGWTKPKLIDRLAEITGRRLDADAIKRMASGR